MKKSLLACFIALINTPLVQSVSADDFFDTLPPALPEDQGNSGESEGNYNNHKNINSSSVINYSQIGVESSDDYDHSLDATLKKNLDKLIPISDLNLLLNGDFSSNSAGGEEYLFTTLENKLQAWDYQPMLVLKKYGAHNKYQIGLVAPNNGQKSYLRNDQQSSDGTPLMYSQEFPLPGATAARMKINYTTPSSCMPLESCRFIISVPSVFSVTITPTAHGEGQLEKVFRVNNQYMHKFVLKGQAEDIAVPKTVWIQNVEILEMGWN